MCGRIYPVQFAWQHSVYMIVHVYNNIIVCMAGVIPPPPPVEVAQDGRTVSLLGEGILAGSCCSQLDTLRSLVGVLGVPLAEAVAMLSESPARSALITPHWKVL